MMRPYSYLSPLCLLAALAPTVPLAAQRTLADLQREFIAESRRLDAEQPSGEQRDALLKRQIDELGRFVTDTAAGDDRWNGRLMLADLNLVLGRRDPALAALRGIDAEAAPALVLVSGATMAQHLGERELRDRWITDALAKDCSLADRMAIARLLMVVLHEVERADEVFGKALAAAADDEQRAFVRWHRADAMRDREDLPDNAAFDELEKLAKELPDTYWGSVAKDRLRATQLAPGTPAIDFTAKAIDGSEVALKGLAGKAVVLVFWTLGDYDLPKLVETLQSLKQAHGDALAIVAVSLDREPEAIRAGAAKLGMTWPVIGDGKGIENDVALRWFAEGPNIHVIDRAGKIQALGLHVGTADARAELTESVAAALR